MKRLALLFVVMTALASTSRATPPAAEATFPGFNGRVVFTTDVDGNVELCSINPDGTSLTRLTNDPATDRYPAVSSDGARIAFASNRDGDNEIYVMNADGTGLTQLTHNTTFETQPAWSPDGSKIAFHTTRDGTSLPSPGIFNGHADWSPLIALAGDANRDDTVNAVDALQDLRYVAALGQPAECIAAGNVKCDDGLTATDALFILRYVAQLPVNLPQSCRGIGT